MSGGPPPQNQQHNAGYNSNQSHYTLAPAGPPQPVGSPPPTYVSAQNNQGPFQPAPVGQQHYGQPQQIPMSPIQPAGQPMYTQSPGAQAGYYPADAKAPVAYVTPQQTGQPMYVLAPQATGVDQYGQPIYASYVAAPQPAMSRGMQQQPPTQVVTTTVVKGSSAGGAAAGGCAGGCCGALAGCCAACCCCCTV
ncbi:hypothetical protein GQ53DRAFT_751605, partial [Thozetella sp. PMI_491]